MRISSAVRWGMVGVFVTAATSADFSPVAGLTAGTGARRQLASRTSPSLGQQIDAQDGDTIVVDDDARLKVRRRRHARVRVRFNSAQRWLILLASYPSRGGGVTDGRVDGTFTFNQVSGEWPLEERWEGDAVIEEYSVIGEGGGRSVGLAFRSPQGIVQLFGRQDEQLFKDPAALVALSYRGSGWGGASGISFDEAEQRQVAVAIQNAQASARLPAGTSTVLSTGVSGATVGSVITEFTVQAEGVPVRIGGDVGIPRKIYDVPPVMPETARQAGIRGVVILELTIGIDGTVTNARPLQSIPLLDAAALDCARQWRYEPVLRNGKPVPVIMTATVNFP